jgi:hypothetical protein
MNNIQKVVRAKIDVLHLVLSAGISVGLIYIIGYIPFGSCTGMELHQAIIL